MRFFVTVILTIAVIINTTNQGEQSQMPLPVTIACRSITSVVRGAAAAMSQLLARCATGYIPATVDTFLMKTKRGNARV